MPTPLTRRQFVAGTTAACAASALASTGSTTAAATTQTDAETLEGLVDDAARRALDDHDAGGLAVTVADPDSLPLAKGYGHAFESEDVPVDADETLFSVGSVSKVATWTAAMQLVDRGRLAVDEPVDGSLTTVDLPDDYEPVTLERLATHTAGFELRGRYDSVQRLDNHHSLAASVTAHVPAQIYSPGDLSLYTNYAAALTGQLIADVTGVGFGEYVAENLFAPLGMSDSTFAPAPDGLVPDPETATEDVLRFYSEVPPASGLHATATDMGRLLRAHLNGGVVDGERALSAAAVEAMHRQWYTPHEALDGMAFGLFEETRGETRLLTHSGATPDFSTDFVLVPEEDVGLYVAAHGREASAAVGDVVDAVLDELVPTEPSPPPAPTELPTRADALTGRYRSVSTAENTSYEKLVVGLLSGSPIEVRVAESGHLVTEQGGETDRWVEREPLVFEHVNGDERLVFRTDGGRVTHLFRGLGAYTPMSAVDRLSVQGWLALAATVGALSGVVGWPAARGWRRLRGGTAPPASAGRARWVVGGAVGSLVAFVGVVLALALALPMTGAPPLFSWPPAWFWLVFGLPTLGGLLAVASAGYAVVAWHGRWWSLAARIHYTVVVASAAVLVALASYWNLLWV